MGGGECFTVLLMVVSHDNIILCVVVILSLLNVVMKAYPAPWIVAFQNNLHVVTWGVGLMINLIL